MIALFTAAAVPARSAVIPASDIQDAVTKYVSGISGTDNIEYSAVIPRLFDVNVEGSGATVIEVSHDAGKKIGHHSTKYSRNDTDQ